MKILADENIPFIREVFSHIGEVETISGRDITQSSLKNIDILIVRSITKVNKELLDKTKVKFVGTATIGLDHIDIEYLESRKIAFASAPGSNATSVAEYIVSALLNISETKDFKLKGSSIGIVGVGNVGSRVAKRCEILGMDVKLNDPPLAEKSGDPKYVDISEIYNCDIITVHTPLTKDGTHKTKHLINGDFLGKTKRGLIFINSSRGSVVKENDLIEFIYNGHIKGTILDVWEHEPAISIDLLNKVDIATPHIAGYSYDGKVKGVEMIYRAVLNRFKIESAWRLQLPEPPVPEIDISKERENPENRIKKAIYPVYNVMKDDKMLRKISKLCQNEQPAYFDKLRKEYPVRREFANTHIICGNTSSRSNRTIAKLKKLEFIL